MAGKTEYRGYRIYYWAKPIPCRAMDWGFAHEDFDGAGDNRWGYAASKEEAKAAIDEQIEDNMEEFPLIITTCLHGSKESAADKLYGFNIDDDDPRFEVLWRRLVGALYEVKFHIDMKTGTIVAIDDRVLSDVPFDEHAYLQRKDKG
ncbi:hypothetical protein LCGC14_0243990 [marine sediment metagenome]|uniref:Uncharacterized protein n=1 Tax=marine sediment metagenome TaxID=412755 RepID=A0A0F9UMU2_9ZZZZ